MNLSLRSIYIKTRGIFSLLRENLAATVVFFLLLLYTFAYAIRWLGTPFFWGALLISAPFLVVAILILLDYMRKRSSELERMRRSLSRYIKLLRKGRESVYRNLDARNILDAFEKAPGIFYVLYGELKEDVITKDFEHMGITYIIPDRSAEKIMRHFVSTLEGSKEAFNYETGLSSFFIIRTEDELVPPEAYDKVKVWIKSRAKMMHAAKDGEFDLPIWDVEEGDIQRKMGFMILISGIDIPKRIVRDCRMAREQYIILKRMQSMKDVKKLASSAVRSSDLDKQAEQLVDLAHEIREAEARQVLDPGETRFYSLEDAIRRTFPELGGNERRRVMEAIDRAASNIINSLLGSELVSPEEVKANVIEQVERELRGKFPDEIVAFIMEAIRRSDLGDRLVKHLGENYVGRLAGRARERVLQAASIDPKSKSFQRIFGIMIKSIGRDMIPPIRRELENLLEELDAYIREKGLSEREGEISEEGGSEEEAGGRSKGLKELIDTLRELLSCLDELESVLSLEEISRVGEIIEKLSSKARLVNNVIHESIDRYGYLGDEDECGEIRRELITVLKRIDELKHDLMSVLDNLSEAASPLSTKSIEEIKRELDEELSKWIPSKELVKDELLKSIQELYRKDLKLYISLVVGNPLKKLYYRLRGVKNR